MLDDAVARARRVDRGGGASGAHATSTPARAGGRVHGLDHRQAAQPLAAVAGGRAAGRDRAGEVLEHAAVRRRVRHDRGRRARRALVRPRRRGRARASAGRRRRPVALDDDASPRSRRSRRGAGSRGRRRSSPRAWRAAPEANSQQRERHVLALDRVQPRGRRARARASTGPSSHSSRSTVWIPWLTRRRPAVERQRAAPARGRVVLRRPVPLDARRGEQHAAEPAAGEEVAEPHELGLQAVLEEDAQLHAGLLRRGPTRALAARRR